ncbi:hypothetical protein M595_3955 [Lyngbya aestuarii BL J]|uniref:Uncharacterized protein n=1 Tax=Lyngbya aestuarii BL J TaxID=1348334 RepID=U7QFM3_9CYAN|nr:hypothetical protein [Lyngbya aestuarii]ERT06062.1 hypothetical protein M595_3955 [Lyngbya aestuarii BL J]
MRFCPGSDLWHRSTIAKTLNVSFPTPATQVGKPPITSREELHQEQLWRSVGKNRHS